MGESAASPGEPSLTDHDRRQAEQWLRRNDLAGLPHTPTTVATRRPPTRARLEEASA